jgi:hypothetical protein
MGHSTNTADKVVFEFQVKKSFYLLLCCVQPVPDDAGDEEIVDVVEVCLCCRRRKFVCCSRFEGVHPTVAVGRIGLGVRPL